MAARKRRAARGEPDRAEWGSVWPLLDLHGLTGDEAVRRTERWLGERRADGVRTVVVVTGRGNRSAGPPVLRAEVETLLERMRGGEVVASYEVADGGGAFRVQLRRPPPPPPAPREPRLDALDPDVVRAAEEALWELGVRPTAALVAREAARIVRERGGRA